MAKPLTNNFLLSLFNTLYSAIDKKPYSGTGLTKRTVEKFGKDWTKKNIAQAWNTNQAKLGDKLTAMAAKDYAPTGADLGTLAKTYIGQHPFQTAGLAGLGLANLGGLTDNDQFGGQLIGAGLGGLASTMTGDPLAKAAITMGGGTLGSLFDKLRAQKEQEEAMQAQYRR
jgi:hypothetical protein